jgi:putative membrane protein
MERRSFLFALGGAMVLARQAAARPAQQVEFRTADLMGGEFAMQTSNVALIKSSSPDIIQFANAEIAEQLNIATALAAAPGTAPLRRDQALVLTRLQRLPAGRGFDAMYVRGQIAGHQELLALNSTYLRSGNDRQFETVAMMSLPIIQQHLSVLNGMRNMA